MKISIYVLTALILLSATGFAQTSFPSYYSNSDLSLTSPGALKFGLYGYDNPAVLTYLHQPDFSFMWTDSTGKGNAFNKWGAFLGFPNFGFGAIKTKMEGGSVIDYRLSVSFGDRATSFGLGYGFTGGDKALFGRSNLFTLGSLFRPDPHVSVGIVGTTATSGDHSEAVFDLGLRPMGNEVVTLFADYGIRNKQSVKDGNWSAGAAVEFLPGIRLTGRYFDTKTVAFGLDVGFGRASVSTKTTFDGDGNHAFNTYGVRLGAYDRTVLSKLMKGDHYVEVNLFGQVKYQRFVLFDEGNTLSHLLSVIKAAREDETIGGIAINTSGMQASREMLWELREELKNLRSAGKKVVIFIDRPSMDEYHFATVADRIVLDPDGLLLLPGYATGRTFLKGTLEKLGIGYDEWRFFKYKSATESLSREKMSDADREQRQKLVDDFYRLAKADICEGRSISSEEFDGMVNDDVLFLPQDAVEKKLVDTLGRWDEVKTMVERLEGRKKSLVRPGSLQAFNLPIDNTWGEPPRIAVIYALGLCAMDEGINARSLSKVVKAAADDARVKAIVLRVDSPGGDGMASDYVAEALRKAKKNKPVIVSQGAVAASGGYWLSMYADTIVAAPNTITGSIGVIGGWLYNKELKEKLGMTTDLVKAGAHADLGFGFTLPLLGVGLPDRNLNENERAKAELAIKAFYKEFVGKVATGRRTTKDKIESIAEGRVWSGTDGKTVGLVDQLGGLEVAIRIAKHKAGIAPSDEVEIVEMPKPGWIDLSSFIPRLVGIEAGIQDDPLIEQLKFRLQHNGLPLPMMPLDELEPVTK
jgi:protease-4